MEFINRDLLYIRPKQACIDWLRKIYPDLSISDSELNAHDQGRAFLIPEFDSEEDALGWVHENWEFWSDELFSHLCFEDQYWPKDRSAQLLREYFDIRYESMVEDILNEPVLKDVEELYEEEE